jgi:ELWxxDGT repeat protein
MKKIFVLIFVVAISVNLFSQAELIKDLLPTANTGYFIEYGVAFSHVEKEGIVYFNAYQPTKGNELWKSDGTVEGTVLIKDINIGSGGSYIEDFTVINDKIVFLC